jgi:hypothetical protein
MHLIRLIPLAVVASLSLSGNANAWFFIWIPTGEIQRAMETDPDTITVNSSDRHIGKCAGFHHALGKRYSRNWGTPTTTNSIGTQSPATVGLSTTESPETIFHERMADSVVAKATDKDSVRRLGVAYSERWSRVAGADRQASRTYGADLVNSCRLNDIPVQMSQVAAWEARQEEAKRKEAEDAQKRAEAIEVARRVSVVPTANSPGATSPTAQPVAQKSEIDFASEAKKSARILGCPTDDVRVVGADGRDVLFAARCQSGETLALRCDPTGICLKR